MAKKSPTKDPIEIGIMLEEAIIEFGRTVRDSVVQLPSEEEFKKFAFEQGDLTWKTAKQCYDWLKSQLEGSK